MKTVEGRRGEKKKKKLLRGYSKEKGEGREQKRRIKEEKKFFSQKNL